MESLHISLVLVAIIFSLVLLTARVACTCLGLFKELITLLPATEGDRLPLAGPGGTQDSISDVVSRKVCRRASSNDIHVDFLLGSGRFGEVFRGRLDDKVVAIKVVYACSDDAAAAEQVVQAFSMTLGLSHPNIVTSYQVQQCLHVSVIRL